MSIASFMCDEKDLTANTPGTRVEDLNGAPCALIKVRTTEHNFSFDFGQYVQMKKEEQNEKHPAEIWVWVPQGVKRISIQHPQLGIIPSEDLRTTLKRAKTYILELTSEAVSTITVDYNNRQFLDAQIFPANAEFLINGMPQALSDNGFTAVQLAFGRHNYRISAPDYHPLEGVLEINDKDNRHKLNVRLKQAFGWLTITGDKNDAGAKVYVDDEPVGQLPLTHHKLSSGPHEVRVLRKLSRPYEEKVSIKDSVDYAMRPRFVDDFGTLTVTLPAGDKDAVIYIDDEPVGNRSWTGKLGTGRHVVEARRVSHTPCKKDVVVVNGEERRVELQSPTPIYGKVEFVSKPAGADVYIDGVKAGVTPYISDRVLIGKHNVKMLKKGHKDEEFSFSSVKDELFRKELELVNFCNTQFVITPSYASLYVDGTYVPGSQQNRVQVTAGDYQIKIRSHGYSDYNKKMRLDGNTPPTINVTLHRNFVRKNEFYLQAGMNCLVPTGMNFGLGMYLANFNLEANYILGFVKSDEVNWSPTTFKDYGSGYERYPFKANYTPWAWNVKVGYGIRLNSRLRITPQVGVQQVFLHEKITEQYYVSEYTKGVSNANCMAATFGARFSCALAPILGISLTPEYVASMAKSEGYQALGEYSPKLKKFNSGFNVNFSVNMFF